MATIVNQRIEAMPSLSQWEKQLLTAAIEEMVAGGVSSSIPQPRTTYMFNDPAAGFVLTAVPNASLWRMRVKDSVPSSPVGGIEDYVDSGFQESDERLEAGSGPVLHGQFANLLYRFVVDDTDPVNPKARWKKITSSQINTNDYYFQQGSSFVNRGRNTNNWWMWLVNDTDEYNWRGRIWPFNGEFS